MQIATQWLKGLPPDEADQLEKTIRNSVTTLLRLDAILNEKEEAALRDTVADYETASWAYRQADNNGYRRCLREIQGLLNFLRPER